MRQDLHWTRNRSRYSFRPSSRCSVPTLFVAFLATAFTTLPAAGSDAGVWDSLPPFGFTGVIDTAGDRLVGFLGSTYSSPPPLSFVMTLSLSSTAEWRRLETQGGPQSGWIQGGIYDPVRNGILTMGKFGDNPEPNQTWMLELGGVPTWVEVVPSGMFPRWTA